jgi:hypothetical protein
MNPLRESGERVAALPWPSVTALCWDDAEGALWASNAQHGGLVVVRPEGLVHYSRASSALPDNAVTAIFIASDGTRWFGTARSSIFIDDARGLSVIRPPDAIRLPIELITEDPKGRVWVTTQGQVLGCYRGGAIDEALTEAARGRRARCVHRAPDGALWMVGDGPDPRAIRLLRFDGERFEEHDVASPHMFTEPRALFSGGGGDGDGASVAITIAIYVAAFGATLRYAGGASSLVTPADFGLEAETMELVAIDRRGRLWARYQPRVGSREHRLACWDGGRAVDFVEGTPVELGFRGEILDDGRGRLWFASARAGLVMLDAQGWMVLPVAPRAAVASFHTREDHDLFLEPMVRPDTARLFEEPRVYQGQKVVLTGELRSGVEDAGLTLLGERQDRGIFPDRQRAASLARRAGVELGLDKREPVTLELAGYLEFEGGYGPLGGCPYRFTITEAYPRGCSEAERARIQMRYRIALKSEHAEAQSIRDLLEELRRALERGDLAALTKLAYPASPWARELADPKATARFTAAAPLRITYDRAWIRLDGPTAANVRMLGARVEPRLPTTEVTLAFQSVAVGKVEKAWRVRGLGLEVRPKGAARALRGASEVEALNERIGRVYRDPFTGRSSQARGLGPP